MMRNCVNFDETTKTTTHAKKGTLPIRLYLSDVIFLTICSFDVFIYGINIAQI